jgi:hypothetical protein
VPQGNSLPFSEQCHYWTRNDLLIGFLAKNKLASVDFLETSLSSPTVTSGNTLKSISIPHEKLVKFASSPAGHVLDQKLLGRLDTIPLLTPGLQIRQLMSRDC